ncbi:hypothetical protein UlMin_034783 [Ulmus minor]
MASSILMILFLFGGASALLFDETHYSSSCPDAVNIIKNVVKIAIDSEARMGASLLRLHFHDCFVNGCDGSVLLDDNSTFTGEKTAFANANSLRGFEVVDDIKAQLESACPGIISCADILAVAARDAVVELGGTTWAVKLGRKDSKTAKKTDAITDIPPPFLNLTDLIAIFSKKGFTKNEMVVLSGAHTIGQASCTKFRDRLYNESRKDIISATMLKESCPSSGGDDNLIPFDSTPEVFDNAFFVELVGRKGLLHSDQQLYSGALGKTDTSVLYYSLNTLGFLSDFGKAMVKMGDLSPPAGFDGEIRTNCRKAN